MVFHLRGFSQTAFWLFAATLVAAPLPLGSNRDWAIAPVAVALGVALLVQALGASRKPEYLLHAGNLVPAVILFVCVIGWALLQSSTVNIFGAGNTMLEQAYANIGEVFRPRIAIRPDAVVPGVMRWLCYAAAFWLSVQFGRDIRQARLIVNMIVVTGCVVTIYALAAGTSSLSGTAVLFPKFGTGFSGTFVNRNNYATFAGVAMLGALAMIGRSLPSLEAADLPFRLKVRRLMGSLGGTSAFYAAAIVILFTGVMLSLSRAGILSLFCGLISVWLLGRRRSLVWPIIATVVVVALLSVQGDGQIVSRFVSMAIYGGDSRADIYRLTIDAISMRPWTGWGLGSFQAVYTLLQPLNLSGLSFDKAHNTYLELMLDLGIPVGLVLPAIVLWIVIRCMLGLRTRAKDREIPGLAVSSSILVGVHALFDFSLQIPAVALVYATLLGVGWAQSWSSREVPRP